VPSFSQIAAASSQWDLSMQDATFSMSDALEPLFRLKYANLSIIIATATTEARPMRTMMIVPVFKPNSSILSPVSLHLQTETGKEFNAESLLLQTTNAGIQFPSPGHQQRQRVSELQFELHYVGRCSPGANRQSRNFETTIEAELKF